MNCNNCNAKYDSNNDECQLNVCIENSNWARDYSNQGIRNLERLSRVAKAVLLAAEKGLVIMDDGYGNLWVTGGELLSDWYENEIKTD